MNKKLSLTNLIAKANQEQPPVVDVASNVLSTLSWNQPSEVISYKPLAWIASASTAMAAGITVAAFMYIRSSADNSMNDLYQAISWVAQ